MFGQKSMLSVEGIKTHSNLREIMNGAFINLSKLWNLKYSFSSGSKIGFLWLIARWFFAWHSNNFELEKHCKQYKQNF